MKRLLTADLHLDLNIDNFITKDGVRGRLHEQELCILEMVEYALANGIKEIDVLGDVFHFQRPSPQAYDVLFSVLNYMVSKGLFVRLLAGNHDMNNTTNALEPVAEAFKGNDSVDVVSSVCVVDSMLFIPHVTDMHKFNEGLATLVSVTQPKYILGHFQVDGAVTGAESMMLSGSDFSFSSFPPSVKRVFVGHIHKPQSLTVGHADVAYTGSIVCVDFGERNDVKGFIVWDDSDDTFVRVALKSYIEYEQVDLDESDVEGFDWSVVDGKVVKVVISNHTGKYSVSDIERMAKGAVMLRSVVTHAKDAPVLVRDGTYSGLSVPDALKKFVGERKDAEEILSKGRAILSEVGLNVKV